MTRFVLLFLLCAGSAGCDCHSCGGVPLEVVDAMTGEPIPAAEASFARHAHGRRHRVKSDLKVGEYRIWVRAPGYRQVTERVDINRVCEDFEAGCPTRAPYIVALERR